MTRRTPAALAALALTLAGCGAAGSPASNTAADDQQPTIDAADPPSPTIEPVAPERTPLGIPSAICLSAGPTDRDLVIDSAIFDRAERVRVHFTPCALESETPLPVLYMLHGAGANETQWIGVGLLDAADRAVARGTLPPAVIVIPDASAAYACSNCTDDLADHLLDEVEPVVADLAPLDISRRAIGGISRGGGYALEIAGADPAAFIAVSGHSAVPGSADAIEAIAASEMEVYLDVGIDDSFLASTEEMARELVDQGSTVDLAINAGGHDRPYWRIHTPEYIDFYGRVLR